MRRVRIMGACATMTFLVFVQSGCVRRTITITSDPPGALVWLNDREIGRTPVDVDFTYYGEYDVRLVKDGYEPLLTSGKASPPVWDNVPLDLGAELWPAEVNSRITWHYELEPATSDPAAVRARAESMRGGMQPDVDADATPAQQPAPGQAEPPTTGEPPPDHP